MVSSNLLDS